eukprot:CAMPEP_0172022136 /NCGR_PEP_ID=MMETSP1041-20130122/14099_1 /TAXON_ID=464988 /ORGANISM="Hemiselmis andersenii, Strain CCMP439" /LENGTH=59 /DNA_ID=CAMNT_0012677537 /DNA_START=649 /DNA_END=825 /DNA_ORIENTATION=+
MSKLLLCFQSYFLMLWAILVLTTCAIFSDARGELEVASPFPVMGLKLGGLSRGIRGGVV